MKFKISPMVWAIIVSLCAVLLSLAVGSVSIPIGDLLRMLLGKIPGLHLVSNWPASYETILI